MAVYGILALAATARGIYQVATKLDEAPVAYLLSLGRRGSCTSSRRSRWQTRRRRVVGGLLIEMVGVLTVGVLRWWTSGDFPDETVWSAFGQGYRYVPLLLPFLGLLWLWRTGRTADVPAASDDLG